MKIQIEKPPFIEPMNQPKNPATKRFLNSLGFGESVLSGCKVGDRANQESVSDRHPKRQAQPEVMLSSQPDDLSLPGGSLASEGFAVQRRGLQDIGAGRKKQAPTASKAESAESLSTVGKSICPDQKADPPAPRQSHPAELEKEAAESESNAQQLGQIDFFAQLDAPEQKKSPVISVTRKSKAAKQEEDPPLPNEENVLEKKENAVENRPEDVLLPDEEVLEPDEAEENSAEEAVADPLTLSCPACHEELTLPREFLGIAGTCVWCDAPIVAAQSGRDDSVHVFVIRDEETAPEEITKDTAAEAVESNPVEVESEKIQSPPPVEAVEAVEAVVKETPSRAVPVELPGGLPSDFPAMESLEQSGTNSNEFEESKPSGEPPSYPVESAAPIAPPFPKGSETAELAAIPEKNQTSVQKNGFVDLPFDMDPLSCHRDADHEIPEKKGIEDSNRFPYSLDGVHDKVSKPLGMSPETDQEKEKKVSPVAPPEAPSADAFTRLGQEALQARGFSDRPLGESPNPDLSPFQEQVMVETEESSQPDPVVESDTDPFGPPETKAPVTDPLAGAECAQETGEGKAIDPLETLPEEPSTEEKRDSPFPAAESSVAKKDNQIPEDVLSFLGSSETTETVEKPESKEIDPTPSEDSPRNEPASDAEQLPSNGERKVEGREASIESVSDETRSKSNYLPPPSPAPAPIQTTASTGFKLPTKTKVGLLVVAGLVVGFGIASFLLPVQEYVEKARTFMTETFNRQIGLESNFSPPSSSADTPPES